MNKGVSVIICCYNSAWIIRRTLAALKEQRFVTPLPYEILLIDNRCSDDTVAVAEEVMKDRIIDFRIIREDKPGLVHARRRGIQNAKYKYVVFCDDDNQLCSNYISTVVDIFNNNPNVGAIGGLGIAEFETEPAKIVLDNLECYAVGSQKEHLDYLFGAGLALRTSLVKEIYEKQRCYLMGRTGSKLLSGDDSELVLSVQLRGYKIYATDSIFFTHVLKANRLSEDYYKKMLKGLSLPGPVLEVMRGVLHNVTFKKAIQDYLWFYYQYIKCSILWWTPTAKAIHDIAKSKTNDFRYWGILRLYIIYRQWSKIKKVYI